MEERPPMRPPLLPAITWVLLLVSKVPANAGAAVATLAAKNAAATNDAAVCLLTISRDVVVLDLTTWLWEGWGANALQVTARVTRRRRARIIIVVVVAGVETERSCQDGVSRVSHMA